jgi:hypothetical protein
MSYRAVPGNLASRSCFVVSFNAGFLLMSIVLLFAAKFLHSHTGLSV